MEVRRLLGDSDRGPKAKTITSCDNAFVTNIVSALAAHRTPPGSFALCESEATATNVLSARKRIVSGKCFICAKAKRQQQSAQSELEPTTRYGDEPEIVILYLIFH
ncbi:hypothetical protein [Lysinibacillus xylanilyticus]|uniref:hypothetical protein n=1 Tax=Lysinibacillus xylanilyticus TaxID=582475 RepID=UPI003CFFA15C